MMAFMLDISKQDKLKNWIMCGNSAQYHLLSCKLFKYIAENEEELKSLLISVKESEKTGLKFNIQITKIMVSSTITSWQIDGETMETVTHFIFLGSKTTADGDCSHEIKRCSLEGKLWPN